MVLFSGDGDFRSLVEAMQRKGVRVTVISTVSTQPPMVADDLRRQADIFLDLADLQNKIGRDPGERAPREGRPDIKDTKVDGKPIDTRSAMPSFIERPVGARVRERDDG
jgi:hypothetical protein